MWAAFGKVYHSNFLMTNSAKCPSVLTCKFLLFQSWALLLGMTAKCTEFYPFWQQFHDENRMSTTENNATKCVFLKILIPNVVFRWNFSMLNHNQLSKCIKIRGCLFCFFSIQRESLTYNSLKAWKYLIGYYFWEKGERRNQATHWRATGIWSQQTNNLVTAKSQKREEGVTSFILYINLL